MTPAATPGVLRLLGLPVRMLAAAAEHWEAMLREYVLRGLGGQSQSYSQDEIAHANSALASVMDAADGHLGLTADVTVTLGLSTTRDLSLLQGILDDVCNLIGAGDMLVLRPLPEMVALRNWLCEQAIEQAAGAPPVPWTLDPALDAPAETAAPQWDEALAPPGDTPWLVGDDRNRIVAASPAALELLGWQAEDLIGQRLLVVIPHKLREAHITGFTRSVVGGGGDLLGKPLALPALTRLGREIPITLTLTRHAARAGRHVYLARLEANGSHPT